MLYKQVDISNPGVTRVLVSGARSWICRDSAGLLHVIYNKQFFTAGAPWRPMHGYSLDNGATWTIEELPGAPTGVGSLAIHGAIMVDSSDVIHVIYEYRAAPSTTHILKHAYKSGGVWTTEDITSWTAYSPTASYSQLCCVLDAFNTIHALWTRALASNNFQLQYIQGTTGSWSGETTVLSTVSNVTQPSFRSLVVDAAGTLHFIYSLSADRTKIRERTGAPFGAEVIIETFGFDVYPYSAAACLTEIALGIRKGAGTLGYIKRQPTPGAWEGAEAVFTPDPGYYISSVTPVFSMSNKEGLAQVDASDTTYWFKQKLWQKIGGIWKDSPYQSAPDQQEDSSGFPLNHLYPVVAGVSHGLLADNEIMTFRSIYDDVVPDYGVAVTQGIFPPPAGGGVVVGKNIANDLIRETFI